MGEPDIDLYADDLDEEFNDGNYDHETNVDLYDDVITRSDDRNVEGQPSGPISPHRRPSGTNKRLPVCIGNLTWWTTDKDLIETMHNIGINDILDIKFHENRANGQSKGYCIIYFASETSLKIVAEKLPKRELHGQNPVVTPCNKQNLNYFEMQSRKGTRHEGSNERGSREREWERRDFKGDFMRNMNQERPRSRNNPSQPYQHIQRGASGIHLQHPPPHQGPPPIQYQPGNLWMPPPPQIHMPPPTNRPGHIPTTSTGVPPLPPGLQGLPPLNHMSLPPTNLRLPPLRGPPPPITPRNTPVTDTRLPQHQEWERQHPPQHIGPPSQPQLGVPNRSLPSVLPSSQAPPVMSPIGQTPNPHVNPAFLPHHQPVVSSTASVAPPATSQSAELYNRTSYPEYHPTSDRPSETSSVSDSEFEEIMTRNRTVSSSAISRAVADASAGDYATAIETLVTAISLIKQSKAANDERSKILISSLQDTLHGIESKSYGSRSRERARSRERDRSRERSSRREKLSRRDRSRSRERDYRDRSRERDRYHEDRYRDKDRDHDRDRRSRH